MAQMGYDVATLFRVCFMASSDVVRARIDKEIKEEASNVLSGMGLSISDAIRMLLTHIATDKALPFDLNRVASPLKRKSP